MKKSDEREDGFWERFVKPLKPASVNKYFKGRTNPCSDLPAVNRAALKVCDPAMALDVLKLEGPIFEK
jgi:hypothetical protein